MGCQQVILVLQNLNKTDVKVPSQNTCTDSTSVLKWLAYKSSVRATFLLNQFANFQGKNLTWHHVQTHENPADPASKGVKPSKFDNTVILWVGPDRLKTHKSIVLFKPEGIKEKKNSSENVTVMTVGLPNVTSRDVIDFSKHNLLRRVTGIVAFVL